LFGRFFWLKSPKHEGACFVSAQQKITYNDFIDLLLDNGIKVREISAEEYADFEKKGMADEMC